MQFRQTVVNTMANVKQLYYDLIYAIDNLEAQRKSLALAEKLLDENQIKVRVGHHGAARRGGGRVRGGEPRGGGHRGRERPSWTPRTPLKRVDLPGQRPRSTGPTASSRPTGPRPSPCPVDTDAARATALEKRTDVVAARKNLENALDSAELREEPDAPRGRPAVASYGAVGQGGTQRPRRHRRPADPPIPGGYRRRVSATSSAATSPPGPSACNVPTRSSTARPRRTRPGPASPASRPRPACGAWRCRSTQEVRSAARAVETNFKRVASTRAARILQERRLDAEKKRFAAGMSTNFLVTQSQRDLAVAEVAELRAIADYRKSLVNFERVQEAGGGGVLFTSHARRRSAAARTAAGSQHHGRQATRLPARRRPPQTGAFTGPFCSRFSTGASTARRPPGLNSVEIAHAPDSSSRAAVVLVAAAVAVLLRSAVPSRSATSRPRSIAATSSRWWARRGPCRRCRPCRWARRSRAPSRSCTPTSTPA